ncbi:purine/pyrimidine permease, partial [Deltaproteobacteria bacterium OttesenSCG-928-K17]|nr:purine/pyrimidine permease [Deltaproteobacteria bacterium OttesenSCG-928-K17]
MIIANAAGVSEAEKQLMIQCTLIMAGLSTLIQLFPVWRVGSKLPIIFSAGFTFVPTMTVIAATYGLPAALGAQLIGGLLTIGLGLGIKKVHKYFPPVVTGTIILSIGLSLYPIAINYMAGGLGSPSYGALQNWAVAGLTLGTVLYFNLFVKSYLRLASMIFGVAVGYLAAAAFGLVNFSNVGGAAWLTLPVPLQFGLSFQAPAIIAMVLITIVNVMQSVGDLSGTTVGGMDREPSGDELANGVVGVGVVTIIGSLFGAPAVSSYSQNVGIVSMTKVISRRVFTFAALFMLFFGLFPKFSAILSTLPPAVIGGATVVVFGMITITGIRLIMREELTARNCTIVGLSIALGVGVSMAPAALNAFPESILPIIREPIVVAGFSAFILNLLAPESSSAQEAIEREAME